MDKNKSDNPNCFHGHEGKCCCNCKKQIELYKHPWNKVNKGPITESTGMYACIAIHESMEYKGVLFEKQHGSCELHESK